MKKMMIVTVLGVLTVLTAAAAPYTLTEETAVELALANNLSLKSEAVSLQAKQRALKATWNQFYPSLNVSGTLARANTAQNELDAFFQPTGNTLDPWSATLSAQASLMINAAVFSAFDTAVLDYRAGILTYEAAERRLSRDVRKSFYNLLLLASNVTLLEQNIETAGQRREQARLNYENGLVPELTVLQAGAAEENLKPALENVKVAYEMLLMKLKLDLGLTFEDEVTLEGSLDVEPKADDIPSLDGISWTDNPDIRSLMLSVESLERSADAVWISSVTPSVSLSAGYVPSLAYAFDPDTDWLDGESWTDRGSLSFTIAMPLDGLLPNSRARNSVAQIEESASRLRYQLEQAISFAELEARNLVLTLRKSQASMSALELNVELARRAYELAEESFAAGLKDLLDVRSAQDDLNRARVDLLNERYTYITALLDIEYTLGTAGADF